MFIRQSARRVVSPDEHRKLVAYFKKTTGTDRLYCLYLLVRYTGLRISEALAVTVGDVFDGYDLRRELPATCAKKRGKLRKRTVSLCSKNDTLRTELRRFLDTAVPGFKTGTADLTLPLFRTAHGSPWDRVNCSHALARVLPPAGIAPFSWHDLRASYTTEIYNLTGDIEIAQAALGHEDSRTTRRYLQLPVARLHHVNTQL